MATVQDIYTTVCYDLMEDGGLVLGLVTVQQFFDHLNLTIQDFLDKTGILRRIWTQTIFAATPQYDYPDDILRVYLAFRSGVILPKATVQSLNAALQRWKNVLGWPRFWHEDGVPDRFVEIIPIPVYNGAYIIGPVEPDPPHAVYDSFSALCQVGATQVVLNPAQHLGLTLIGPCKAIEMVNDLGDDVPLIPVDIAMAYLPFGVLHRIFSGDNELKDEARSAYCLSQYQEGVNLMCEFSDETGEPNA